MKNFPEADKWMWNYCMFLGAYKDSRGVDYDLGVYKYKEELSLAIVYGNEAGSYISGEVDALDTNSVYYEVAEETMRRYTDKCQEIKDAPSVQS